MVDRRYLPYPSAREYQDRKMAKWMGFFLSEHQTALKTNTDPLHIPDQTLEERLSLIQRAYLQQLRCRVVYKKKKKKRCAHGFIKDIQDDQIAFKTEGSYIQIAFQDLLALTLEEIIEDDQS